MVARGKDGGRDNQGVWDRHVHTAAFKMDNQWGPNIWHIEFCSVLRGSLDGSLWEWIHVYLWLSPSAVHLTLSHYLLTGYTLIQNKQLTQGI